MTGGKDMSLARFETLLEAYGGQPARWPAAERAAAEALLASNPTARALHARAAELDALLDKLSAPQPSPALRARILAQAPRPARPRLLSRLAQAMLPAGPVPYGWRPAGAALAAALVLGMLTGGLQDVSDEEAGGFLQIALLDDNYDAGLYP
jgi:anti-sigma factor RsiW